MHSQKRRLKKREEELREAAKGSASLVSWIQTSRQAGKTNIVIEMPFHFPRAI